MEGLRDVATATNFGDYISRKWTLTADRYLQLICVNLRYLREAFV